MFPPEKLREMIVQQISEQLNREASLGEIKVGLFSGVSISDFALSESSTFKKGTFVQSKKFVLKFQLLPLLQKKVLIDEVTLESPQIRIVQYADGKTFNFSDLVSPSQEEKQTPSETETPSSQPISLTISKAKISNGKVVFIDRSPNRLKVKLNPIDLTVIGTGLDKPMSLDLLVGIESKFQKKNIKGELTTKAVLDLPKQKVQFDLFQWKMKGLILDMKGKVVNFSKPEMDIAASIHDVILQELSEWIALPKEVRISGSPQMGLELKGDLDNLNTVLSVDLSKTDLVYADIFKKDDSTEFSISFKGKLEKQKDLSLSTLKIKLAGIETELNGVIRNISSSDPSLKIVSDTKPFDLKEISKLSKLSDPYDPSGKLSLKANLSGSLNLIKLNGTLNLEGVSAKYEKIRLNALAGKIEFTENSFDMPHLAGKIGAAGSPLSDFSIKMSFDDFIRPDIALEGNFSQLDIGMFTSDEKDEETKKGKKHSASKPKKTPPYKGPLIKARGQVTIKKLLYDGFSGNQVNLSWKLRGITPNLNKINGNAELLTKDGKLNLKTVPYLKFLGKIAELANKFTRSNTLDPSAMVFQKISGTYKFQNGIAKTNNFQIHSPKADLYKKGTIRLSDQDKNLLVTLKLPKGSIAGTVGQFTSDDAGRPTFSFKVTGTEKTQKVRMDTAVVKKRAKEELKRKGTELLKKEGQKLLEGLFGR